MISSYPPHNVSCGIQVTDFISLFSEQGTTCLARLAQHAVIISDSKNKYEYDKVSVDFD